MHLPADRPVPFTMTRLQASDRDFPPEAYRAMARLIEDIARKQLANQSKVEKAERNIANPN